MSSSRPEVSSVLRFDLAIQRNHILVYTLALLTGLAGKALGAFEMRIDVAILLAILASLSSALLYYLYRRGIDRRYLAPVWITSDIFFVTMGVYASGGFESSVYVWYAATASAAAFAAGKRAALYASVMNVVAYISVLMLMGQATLTNGIAFAALGRMIFLSGASYFFLIGVANLQEKRHVIRQLEMERSRKIEELTRLTQELADANRRIQEADRLKSQFLANMSHELRTPMNSIIGFSEILSERLEGKIDAKHVGFLRHIHSSGQHLLGIINDILDLSKIEAGKMEVYAEFFSTAPVIESVCQMMRGMTKASPNFVVDIADGLPQIETDLAKFKQVLFNLLSNAVKFSPAGAPIHVSATLHDGAITVAVRDRGIGIDPQHHQVIFEEFRQVDGTARREFGGTGLGLALVKKFVELQGGRVALESRLGEGSTFSFTLPVRSRAAVVTRQPEPPQPRAERVLVVEDDPHAYDLLASAISSAGFLPIRAHHGDEALRLAKETRPVAVTLDLVLPGVDGWEVLKRLKNDVETRALPVVIISMVENRDLGIALGADDYFVKPVDRERLLARLREIARGEPGMKRLLIIDDDPAVHALLDEDLAGLGFEIARAYNGAEGLRKAEEQVPDVVILDLMMPGMSGLEVAGALKQNPRTANVPIVVLTSKEITSEDRDQLNSKVSTLVPKGNSAREQLVREIRRVTAAS
ncbi:MAG TPA: response regulator [Thermoanaerobaculia bacterium]|nr:response regulator [Thermoanaerobaculia bacterium]